VSTSNEVAYLIRIINLKRLVALLVCILIGALVTVCVLAHDLSQTQARADQWARMFDKCRNTTQPEDLVPQAVSLDDCRAWADKTNPFAGYTDQECAEAWTKAHNTEPTP